jgi:hypothetical protein
MAPNRVTSDKKLGLRISILTIPVKPPPKINLLLLLHHAARVPKGSWTSIVNLPSLE